MPSGTLRIGEGYGQTPVISALVLDGNTFASLFSQKAPTMPTMAGYTSGSNYGSLLGGTSLGGGGINSYPPVTKLLSGGLPLAFNGAPSGNTSGFNSPIAFQLIPITTSSNYNPGYAPSLLQGGNRLNSSVGYPSNLMLPYNAPVQSPYGSTSSVSPYGYGQPITGYSPTPYNIPSLNTGALTAGYPGLGGYGGGLNLGAGLNFGTGLNLGAGLNTGGGASYLDGNLPAQILASTPRYDPISAALGSLGFGGGVFPNVMNSSVNTGGMNGMGTDAARAAAMYAQSITDNQQGAANSAMPMNERLSRTGVKAGRAKRLQVFRMPPASATSDMNRM
jgi:hypothetical protein